MASRSKWQFLASALLVFLPAQRLTATPNTNLRVVPLGDSITYGFFSSTSNGYRQDLIDLLAASQYTNLTYLGVLTSGTMSQDHHEGYPGATISLIEQVGLKTLNDTLMPGANPNMVLLHAGTNDAYYNHTATAMIGDLGHLLDTIYRMKPNITVVVSQIIENRIPYVHRTISAYNALIPGLVQNYTRAEKRIVMVNQSDVNIFTDQNPQHEVDDTHPGDVGFAKIARNFFYGVTTAINNTNNTWVE